MNVEDFRLLYDYNVLGQSPQLDSCASLSEEQFTRDLGSSFRSVRDTLVAHLRRRVVLARALARPLARRRFRRGADFANLESVRRRWARDSNATWWISLPRSRNEICSASSITRRPPGIAVAAALADAAAPRESQHLSSRPDRHAAAAIGREAHLYRSDRFLSRARAAHAGA